MDLSRVFDELIKELPWVEATRLVVGDMASRESVKDALLTRTKVLPGHAVCSLAEIAAETLSNARAAVDAPLSNTDRLDALFVTAARGHFQERTPRLSVQMRDRAVVEKLKSFLDGLDLHYESESELAAMIDFYREKNPETGEFIQTIAELWKKGVLSPWGPGTALRAAIEHAEGGALKGLRIFLWAHSEFTPLEERFLEALAKHNEIIAIQDLERCKSPKLWKPHTVWDEMGFLYDELEGVKRAGALWSEIAVFVPQNELYKRQIKRALDQWGVPIADPTLPDAWRDHADWVWWRDFMRACGSGMPAHVVRALLGKEYTEQIAQAIYKRGMSEGASEWKAVASGSKVVDALLLCMRSWTRRMKPSELADSVDELAPKLAELCGRDTTVLKLFAGHLREREYIESYRARIGAWVSIFDEFLSAEARRESPRNPNGVQFVNHGVKLPRPVKRAIVLGTGALTAAKPSYDLWAWEKREVRRIWDRLHSIHQGEDLARRRLRLIEDSVLAHEEVVYSAPDHDLSGKPWALSESFAGFWEASDAIRSGASEWVPWDVEHESWTAPVDEKGASALKLLRPQDAKIEKLSVSKFEDYLKCPFLFHARHHLKLEPEREPGLTVAGDVRGKLVHDVLEKILQEEISSKREIVNPGGREKAKRLAAEFLDAALEREIAKANGRLSGTFKAPALIESARRELISRLYGWIEWEIDHREKHPTLKPALVEAPVELDIVTKKRGTLKLSGKIDRVDSDGRFAAVIDYKSGIVNFSAKDLLSGKAAQLLAYLRAVELARYTDPVKKLAPQTAVGAWYLSIHRTTSSKRGVFPKMGNKTFFTVHPRNGGLIDAPTDSIFARVFENWEVEAERLLEGDFAARPSRPNTDCKSCSFYGTCGFDYKTDRAPGQQEESDA